MKHSKGGRLLLVTLRRRRIGRSAVGRSTVEWSPKATEPPAISAAQLNDVFKQFQEGLRDCMNQMAACRKEVTDLRRQVRKVEQSAIPTVNSREGSLQEHTQTTPAGGPPSQPVVGDFASGGSEQARPHCSGTFLAIGPCHRCGVEGHWARSCPQKIRGNSGTTPAVPEDEKSAQQEPKVQVVGEKDRKKITYLTIDYMKKKSVPCLIQNVKCQ